MECTNAVIKTKTTFTKFHSHEGTVRFLHKKKKYSHTQSTTNRRIKRKKKPNQQKNPQTTKNSL